MSYTNPISQLTLDFNNRVVGDVHQLSKQLFKKKLINQPNQDRVKPELKNLVWMDPNDLIAMDTNRDCYTGWINSSLTKMKGFDWLACPPLLGMDTKEGIIIYDGVGRLSLAQSQGIKSVPVWVVKGTREEASLYFTLIQKTLNRSLSQEVFMSQLIEAGDPEAMKFLSHLKTLGLCIEMNVDLTQPKKSKDPKVKVSTVKQSLKIADISTVKAAVDFIKNSYPESNIIRKELLTGLTWFFKVYPEAKKPGRLYDSLVKYLNWVSYNGEVDQGKLPFKKEGGNIHNNEAGSVAYGLIKLFTQSPHCTSHLYNANDLKHEKLKLAVGIK